MILQVSKQPYLDINQRAQGNLDFENSFCPIQWNKQWSIIERIRNITFIVALLVDYNNQCSGEDRLSIHINMIFGSVALPGKILDLGLLKISWKGVFPFSCS